jgi:hypothetical protein
MEGSYLRLERGANSLNGSVFVTPTDLNPFTPLSNLFLAVAEFNTIHPFNNEEMWHGKGRNYY